MAVADELVRDEPFTPETLLELGRLVAADWVNYDEVDHIRHRVLFAVDRAGDDWSGWESFKADVHASGVGKWDGPIERRHRSGHTGALRLSDVVTTRDLHVMPFYAVWYRPWGIERVLHAVLPCPAGQTRTFRLERRGNDFTERDVAVLDALRPHLERIRRAARTRRLLTAALAGLEHAAEGESRGAVLLRRPAGIEYASPPARRLLQRFFGVEGDDLPAELVEWLEGPAEPFARRVGGRCVRVELVGSALLLEESSLGTGLTPREEEVLAWVASGKTNAEVAEALWLSPATVRKHLENAFAKLGVRTRTAAVARFLALTDADEDQPVRATHSS